MTCLFILIPLRCSLREAEEANALPEGAALAQSLSRLSYKLVLSEFFVSCAFVLDLLHLGVASLRLLTEAPVTLGC